MSIWWVDPVGGSDVQDGSTFALAKKTLLAGLGITFSANDILNLVNTGDFVWPTSGQETDLNSVSGTNYTTDIGLHIRGSDSGGNDAFVTVKPAVTGFHRAFQLRATANYVLMDNVIWDASVNRTDTDSYNVVRGRDNAAGPIKIRYGGIIGAATGLTCDGERALVEFNGSGGTPNDFFSLEYVYFQNVRRPLGSQGGYGATTLKTSMDHCLGIWDNDSREQAWWNQKAWSLSSANVVSMTNCTLYESADTTDIVNIFDYDPAAAIDIEVMNCHSNLIWVQTSGTVNPFMAAGSKNAGVVRTGTVGPNVLLGGPTVSVGSLTADGWYQGTWDANDDDTSDPDTYPLDTVSYTEPASDVFFDATTAYDWVLPNGLTMTIMKDLRLIRFQTNGLFGSTPGALPTVGAGEGGDGDTDMGGGDPDDPATIPFLSVIPFYANVLQYSLNSRFSTEQNRVRQSYLRRDRELKGFREWATRYIQVDTSTTDQIITGIETAELVFLESDEQVQLNAGKVADVFLPDAKVVLLAGGEYSVIKVKNDSATDNALTLITVVD